MSEVQSGTSKNGFAWQRMTVVLEIQGFKGYTSKQVFQVSGDVVDAVLDFGIGDKVEIAFSLYAREWNGKWYNNVELASIKPVEDESRPAPAPAKDMRTNNESLDPKDGSDDLPF